MYCVLCSVITNKYALLCSVGLWFKDISRILVTAALLSPNSRDELASLNIYLSNSVLRFIPNQSKFEITVCNTVLVSALVIRTQTT